MVHTIQCDKRKKSIDTLRIHINYPIYGFELIREIIN